MIGKEQHEANMASKHSPPQAGLCVLHLQKDPEWPLITAPNTISCIARESSTFALEGFLNNCENHVRRNIYWTISSQLSGAITMHPPLHDDLATPSTRAFVPSAVPWLLAESFTAYNRP